MERKQKNTRQHFVLNEWRQLRRTGSSPLHYTTVYVLPQFYHCRHRWRKHRSHWSQLNVHLLLTHPRRLNRWKLTCCCCCCCCWCRWSCKEHQQKQQQQLVSGGLFDVSCWWWWRWWTLSVAVCVVDRLDRDIVVVVVVGVLCNTYAVLLVSARKVH
jgi:hypothetical protein